MSTVPRKFFSEFSTLLFYTKFNRALAAFTLVFWYITKIAGVWWVFAAMEFVYLAFTLFEGPFFDAAQKSRWQSVAWMLFPILIAFFESHTDRITVWGHTFEGVYERWEVVALTWNIIFFSLSLLFLPRLLKGLDKLLSFIFIVVIFDVSKSAIAALAESRYSEHMLAVLYIASCEMIAGVVYIVADLVTYKKLSADSRCCLRGLIYASFPTLAAMFCLWRFSVNHPGLDEGHIFLSGAIAFQLIASSLAMFLIESDTEGLIDRIPWLRKTKEQAAIEQAKVMEQAIENQGVAAAAK